MARKFNIGRQSEHVLNKELHDLFMSMKYINSGNTRPTQDEQAEIPNGSLWLESYFDKAMLNTYDANTKGWNPVFKGHYHPADAFTKPSTPVHGQLWIDHSQGDLLHYYDSSTSTWIAVTALSADRDNSHIGAYNNFIVIDPFNPTMGSSYLMPSEPDGKLFDTKYYIHPSDELYQKNSSVSIDYDSTKHPEGEAWIHINPKNINQVDKRLIKLVTDLSDESAYTVELFDHNTEFYGIDSTTGIGTILLPNDENPELGDFVRTDFGIKLNTREYEYIYAISYGFGNYQKRAGKLVRNSGVVESQDTVYVGPCTEHAFVFLDGLYLEQSKYTHDKTKNSIVITGDDIVQIMDMTVVTFPDYSKGSDGRSPLEFTINQTNGTRTVTGEEATELDTSKLRYTLGPNDAIVGPLTNASSFVRPMAFVSGVHADVTAEPKSVIIEGDIAIIRNIGPMEDGDFFKVMIVEGDSVYVSNGTVSDNKEVQHEDIDTKSTYMLYVEGVLASPSDLDISEGAIKTMGLLPGQNYTLLKASEANETVVIFDSAVSHYSIKIHNDNAANLYNDCDEAVVMVDKGTIVDRNAVIKISLPLKGVNGQILIINDIQETQTDSDNGIVASTIKYYQWLRRNNKWNLIDLSSDHEKVSMIANGYFSTRGSISIINKACINTPYTYYAYTLINGIDEPLEFGYRDTLEGTYDYKVNVRHDYVPNTGSLIAHLNGLRVYPEEHMHGAFTLDEIESIPTISWNGVDYSEEFKDKDNALDNGLLTYIIERPESLETTSYKRQTLLPSDRLEGYTNTYRTQLPLLPGYVTVYVNGLRLPKKEYSVANENTLVLYRDVVGGQTINDIKDPSTWNKTSFNTSNGPIIIDCEKYDTVEVEIREDFSIKELTIPLRYAGQTVFTSEDDGIPKSLLTTRDFLKIYINGVYYGNEYEIHADKEYVSLTNKHTLNNIGSDPIDTHFIFNPAAHDDYQREHGRPYQAARPKDQITFEWR